MNATRAAQAVPEGEPFNAPSTPRLPSCHLRLAITEGILDRRPAGDLQSALWREDPGAVALHHGRILINRICDPPDGRHGLLAERMKELHRPLPKPRTPQRGLTVAEIAAGEGLERETLAALLEHHGYLELAYYGGQQRRRLVSDHAIRAGLGHNVDGSMKRVAWLEGCARAAVFPVFYEDTLPDLLWTLDLPGITAAAQAQGGKRAGLRWLLDHHAYLPNAELARISGYTERGRGEGPHQGCRHPIPCPSGRKFGHKL